MRANPCDAIAEDGPEARAIAYLSVEVPRWNRENHCFSCHNNGDGARALLSSKGTAFAPKGDALDSTIAFLAQPDRWSKNGTDGAFNDLRLARLQFAATLDEAVRSGLIVERDSRIRAAEMLAKDQSEDGSWPIDDAAAVGSPATYGPSVATTQALRMLRSADRSRFNAQIEKAESWIRGRPIQNVHDAYAVLMVLSADNAKDRTKIDAAIDLIRRAQNEDGGWGPFLRSASEPFDTAIALIALAEYADRGAVRSMIDRGRKHLTACQKADGSWAETTRPAGAESYAQRLSTTGWATIALLRARPAALKVSSPKS